MQRFFLKFNYLLFFLIPNVGSVSAYTDKYKHKHNISSYYLFLMQNKPSQYVQNKTSQNFKMSVTHRYRYVCCEMNVFFSRCFHNHFQKTNRSVLCKRTTDLLYFWDVYDINLWEKLAITVKLCLIETRLKKGYDLWGYFLVITR